jgi:hypothetical protein
MDKKFLASVLIRCFWYCFGLLLLWFWFFITAGDWAYNLHNNIFSITRHDFDMINYCGLAVVKVVAIVGFLIPYLAIRFTDKKKKRI